jgi:hypothetical protein
LSSSCFYAWKKQFGCGEEKSFEAAEPVNFLEVKRAATTPPIPLSIASDAVMDPSSALITASESSYGERYLNAMLYVVWVVGFCKLSRHAV